jgi:hypothetical protein
MKNVVAASAVAPHMSHVVLGSPVVSSAEIHVPIASARTSGKSHSERTLSAS